MKTLELKQKPEMELKEELENLKKKLHEMRFDFSLGKLKKTSDIVKAKRDIARILTILRSNNK